MADIAKTVNDLEEFKKNLNDVGDFYEETIVGDAIELLKEQNERIEKMRSLLGEADEEVRRLKEIAKNGNGFIEKCDSRAAQMFSH